MKYEISIQLLKKEIENASKQKRYYFEIIRDRKKSLEGHIKSLEYWTETHKKALIELARLSEKEDEENG